MFHVFLVLILGCMVLSMCQEPEESIGSVREDGAIVAVDSDFVFMEIKPSTLPVEGAGLGVFAKSDLLSNQILCEYRGAIVPASINYQSDYSYSATTSTGEHVHIIPDMDKPICAFINDCADVRPATYSADDLDEIESKRRSLTLHPGFEYNAAALSTKMGKIFIVSAANISAGAEIFFPYGAEYWLKRLRDM